MNHDPSTAPVAASAAHDPPSRQPAPEGGHEAPPASGGDTPQRGEPRLVEPAGRGRLATYCYDRPRCPRCRTYDLHKHRSKRDQGDATGMSWVTCNRCGHRFKVLLM
jgi:hypothetical protein